MTRGVGVARMDEEREWLTVAQVADRFQVGVETVRRWIRSGELKVLNVGGRGRQDYRIRQPDLDAFIDSIVGNFAILRTTWNADEKDMARLMVEWAATQLTKQGRDY